MRTKTRYREIKPPVEESPAENIPEVEIDGEKVEPVVTISAEAGPDVEPSDAVVAAIETSTKADLAKYALLKQIEALRQSQRAAQVPQNDFPTTREGKLALWRQQGGMHEAELTFLEANPELIDLPQLTAHAAAQASQQGHERGSEAHMQATKNIFHEHLARMQEQAANPALQPTPEFFRPPPPPPPPAPRSPAQYVSAPVSKTVPDGSLRELNPGQVKLSAEEVEHARVSGISATEYARQKLRLAREKAAGLRQNG